MTGRTQRVDLSISNQTANMKDPSPPRQVATDLKQSGSDSQGNTDPSRTVKSEDPLLASCEGTQVQPSIAIPLRGEKHVRSRSPTISDVSAESFITDPLPPSPTESRNSFQALTETCHQLMSVKGFDHVT